MSTGWANPKLSTGSSCGQLDTEGKYKCWALKEDGPAHQAWKSIAKPIVLLLQSHVKELGTGGVDLMVEVLMVGEVEERSVPTVLFCCLNQSVRQRAMDLVRKSDIMKAHKGLLMAECSRRRRPLAMEETAEVPALPPGVYATESLRHCGVSVLISGEQKRSPRKATLGGIVFIAGLFYGLVTLYACKQDSSMANAMNIDPQFAFYDESKEDEGSDERHDSATVLELDDISPTAFSSISSRENSTRSGKKSDNSTTTLASEDSKSTVSRGNSSSSAPEVRSKSHKKSTSTFGGKDSVTPELGNIFVSAPKNSLDWALVEIENSNLMLENISLNKRRFMTNSIYWRNQNLHPEAIHPKGVAKRPTDIDVLICTGNSDDALEGRLSGISTYQKVPGSDTFRELWVVKCTNGTFFDGDCGSWVVDCESGNLCGVVVFGYPGHDTAYVIPAFHIFERMQNHLNKRVELSTPELWRAREDFANNSKFLHSLQRGDSGRTIRTERRRSSVGPPSSRAPSLRDPSVRYSLELEGPEEDTSSRRKSWSQNSIQSTIFDTRSLHSTASSHFSKIPTYLASDTHLSVASNYERFQSSNLPLTRGGPRRRTGSIVSGGSHIYRPYSTASTLQSIDSGYGNPPCNNLYVRNLPPEPDEGELREFFVQQPGFEGIRMKLNEPECFVQFSDIPSAMEALRKSDDHRFSADDKWGIMVGFARNGVSPSGTIPSQEDIDLEIGIAELLGAETSSIRRSLSQSGGKLSRILSPKRASTLSSLTLPHIKQDTDKSEMLQEMFAELGMESRESDKFVLQSDDEGEGSDSD